MARQRLGQSSRFKLIIVATVVLCFLHLPINGSQSLAVPGSGREATERASLLKLKNAELQRMLREKGLKVSGNKSVLVERWMEARPKMRRIPKAEEPAILETDVFIALDKKRQLPPLTSPANPEEHVFVPLEGYGQKIEDLFEGEEFAFVRGGVGVGKSTMGTDLARQFPKRFVCVPFTNAAEEAWIANINVAIRSATGTAKLRETSPLLCLQAALELAANDDLILVLDEAHTIFSLPQLCESLLKSTRHPKLLLLSASGEGQGSRAVTPSEINQKFFWTPPVPETADALDELVKQLNEAGVHLDARSVAFFLKFCGGHRSIYVAAMRWVKQMQDETSYWAFKDTVAKVRASIGDGSWATGTILGALAKSRGVKVNGRYSDLDVVPEEFIQRLCEGPGDLSKEIRRELTIQGFVIPVSEGNGEFQRVDWTRPDATYAVANPILASYYRHQLESFRSLKVKVKDEHFVPLNCLDLLLRAIPYLTFARVVFFAADLESNSSLSAADFPYEEQYNAAIIHALKRLGYPASAPLNPRKGKVDVLVKMEPTAFSLECIMAKRSQQEHNEHRNRFDKSKPDKLLQC